MVAEAKSAQPGRNVPADLDSRIPTNFCWYLAVLACIGGFLFGYDTSNIGSSPGFIPCLLSSFWRVGRRPASRPARPDRS